MKREQITIRLPGELKKQLQQEADRRGNSLNETIISVIRIGLECQSSHSAVHSQQSSAS